MNATSASRAAVIIRPYHPDDDAFLFDLFASVRAQDFASLNWEAAQLDALLHMQFTAQTQSYAATYPNAEHGIICENDRPIGHVLAHETRAGIHLVDIALLPEFRGRGIGAALIRDLQARARAGDKPVRLSVAGANRAFRLYKRLGFTSRRAMGPYLMMEWRPEDCGEACNAL